jgi:hypothetical protein
VSNTRKQHLTNALQVCRSRDKSLRFQFLAGVLKTCRVRRAFGGRL